MSTDPGSDPSSRIPTNTELVENLIENFKATCDIKPKSSSQSLEEDVKPQPSEFSRSKHDSGVEGLPKEGEELPEEVKDQSSNERIRGDDFIDEELLKDKEVEYTEEDFQRLKSEAESLKMKGNEQFKNKEYMESAQTYTLALRTCPLRYPKDRAVLYANRAAAKIKLELTLSALEDCTAALELEPIYVKALLRRAQLYESTDKLDEALEDFKKVLEHDSSNKEAIEACMRLPPLINERNEKLKTEMLGKLKDLGNMILRPFGLSTNNFQMVQDPNTGGYSINFKQN